MGRFIAYAKDKKITAHREPYRGAKAVDPSCKNNGDCPYCQGQVKYKKEKQKQKFDF